MKPKIPLNTIQRWMQSVIEHPGSNDEAWRSEEAQNELPFEEAYANVLPSKTLSPVERISIYRRMFFLRMTESMAIDYPGVKKFLGEEIFDRLVAEEYVKKHPSHSYTLNHLGRYFPQFIQESKLPKKEFLYDLARLELSITNNMDAEETSLVTAEMISSVPIERWSNVTLIPIAALELMSFDHNVCEYLDAVNDDSPLPEIKKLKTFCVVYRNNYRTYWEELTEQQHVLLSSLITGTLFGTAIEKFAAQFPDTHDELQQQLFQWFNDWVSSGFFSKIEIS